ncbi:MAG: Ig-like domain repeat protein [Terriglobia bacterium]
MRFRTLGGREQAHGTVRGLSLSELAGALVFSLLFTPAAWAQSARVRAQIVQPVDLANRVVLRGNTPPLARAENDLGPSPDSLPLNRMLLVLKRPPEQEAALRKLLVEQQMKSSPNYHQWLTPAQFGNQFGPADADIQTVSDWLSSQGFEIDGVSAGRSEIEFSGNAALVREAFHTGIHQYLINGSAYWSNARDPQVPAALAPVVAGIASLNNFPTKPMSRPRVPVRIERAEGPSPLYTFKGPDGKIYHALSPADFDTIYDVPPSVGGVGNGLGETIAIVAASNVNLSDWNNFRGAFFLAGPGPNIIVNGPDPGIIPGLEGEADLDMEWAGAIAQFATIDLVVSQDTLATPGIELSALYIVNHNLAPVMSVSYGYCEATLGSAGNDFFDSLWEQAAAQGISVVVAAGDQGSAGCAPVANSWAAGAGLAVSGIASTPFDLAVGGTDFDDASNPALYWSGTNDPTRHSSALSYIPEETLNDSCAQAGSSSSCNPEAATNLPLAGGGGPSTCAVLNGPGPGASCVAGYAKPSWQTGTGVPADHARDIPDVSLFAGDGLNGSFYLFCEADQNPVPSPNCAITDGSEFEATGGTSTSAQTFAAILALVDQKTGQRQGNPNYVLYALAAQPGASCPSNASSVQNTSCVFHDVVTGNNSLPCAPNSPGCGTATPGGTNVLVAPGSNPAVPAWNAGPGYDLATGLGSVNVTNLLNKWSSVSFTPSVTQLSLSPTTLTHGQSAAVSIQVTAQGGTPTGAVSLLGGPGASDPGIASFTLTNGAVSASTSSLPGGTYNVTAHYAGDGIYAASDSSPVQVTVAKENSETTLGIVTFDSAGNVSSKNAANFAYGSPYILEVGVENAVGNSCGAMQATATICPSGTVNLTDNGVPLDSTVSSLNSLGEMDDIPIQLPAGSHTLLASYRGNNSFNPSTSNPDGVTVTQATTSTLLTASSSTVQAENSVTLTATVQTQSNGVAPGGTVQFLNGSTLVSGTVSYSSAPAFSGSAQLAATLSTVLPVTATIVAQYSGDSNYMGSTSAAQTVTVTPGFSLTINPTRIAINAPGMAGSTAVTVVSGGGFSGTVSLSCQLPLTLTEATCSFSPSTLAVSGQSTLKVTTTAPQAAAALFRGRRPPDYVLASAAMLCLLLMALFGAISGPRRLRPAFALSFSLAVLLALTTVGCGGGSQASAPPPPDPGTPAGTYTVTITATSGAIVHLANVPVTIQ